MLLIAPQHLRAATPEEALAAAEVARLLQEYVDEGLHQRGPGTYYDLHPEAGRGAPEAEAAAASSAATTASQKLPPDFMEQILFIVKRTEKVVGTARQSLGR